jgi:hypothetical protein
MIQVFVVQLFSDGSTSIAPSQGNLNGGANNIKYLTAPAPAPMKALPAPSGPRMHLT